MVSQHLEPSAASKEPATWFHNLLIVCGIYWLSTWLVPLFGLASGITRATVYSENLFSALYMSTFLSWERALAAILAGVAVTMILPCRKSWLWALMIALLYGIDYRMRSHWVLPPTAWDQLCMRIERFLPAVACVAAAFVTAWLRRKRLATVR